MRRSRRGRSPIMENLVIGIALFLLLVLGYYGVVKITRKAVHSRARAGLEREAGPPPNGPDPGSPTWRLGKRPAGKTHAAPSSLRSVDLTREEPSRVKATVPPSPKGL